MNLAKKLTQLIRSRRNGEPRDRGAVLVEAAIAIPILLVVILGSVEMGFAWDAKSATVSGARTATLRAASLGGDPATDLRVLQSVIGEIGADNVGRLNDVIIFDASTGDRQQAIDDCRNNMGVCVRYDNANMLFDNIVASTVTSASFDDGTNTLFANGTDMPPTGYACDPGANKVDSGSFCAGARTVMGDAQIGIAVSYTHDWFTGIFPFAPPTFNESTVTSTFLENGAAITPTNAIPTFSGVVASFDNFNSGVPVGTPPPFTSSNPSNPVTTFEPTGQPGLEVLGRFKGGDTITLNIDTPQAAAAPVRVCVTATVWLIGSWDGNGQGGDHDDRLIVDLDGDDPGVEFEQEYDVLDIENNGVQFLDSSKAWDQGLRKTIGPLCTEHQGADIDIDFLMAGAASQGINDESWAFESVTVTAEEIP